MSSSSETISTTDRSKRYPQISKFRLPIWKFNGKKILVSANPENFFSLFFLGGILIRNLQQYYYRKIFI